LKVVIIFPVKYSEWVSNLVLVQKSTGQIILCINFHTLNRDSIKDHFPLPKMEMILQQVAGSQMMSLLDSFSDYNQIKVKREDKYPHLLLFGVPLLMNVCLPTYLMQVPLLKHLCK
jgi:hypothetical protein